MRLLRTSTMLAGTLALAGLAITGCHHQRLQQPQAASVTFLDSGACIVSGPTFGERMPMDVLIPARPIEPVALPLVVPSPATPPSRKAMIVVRAVVDPTGAVSEVIPVRESFPPPTSHERELQTAALAAVMRWRFEPAEMRRLVFGRNDGGQNFWMVKWRSPSRCTVELTFTFPPEGPVSWTLQPVVDAALNTR